MYEHRTTYCSDFCRKSASSQKAREQAAREGKKPRKGVLTGPCKTCGRMFESRIDKMFCSMGCYTASPQFRTMILDNLSRTTTNEGIEKRALNARLGKYVPCLECGTEFYQKRQTKGRPAQKFCNKSCYRSYLSKRFDRWIASPNSIALPQCYDEFLDKEELDCLIDGCDWHGQWLTLHMNQTHGVRAEEFKRAAGFNLSTGVVSRPLAQTLRQREKAGIALNSNGTALNLAHAALANRQNQNIYYRSLEGREHSKKARAMCAPGPIRLCKGCGKVFQQSTPFGKALYHSPQCRSAHYAAKKQAKANRNVRQQNGVE